jgi:tetratricopeptide (TPR) repeat protein
MALSDRVWFRRSRAIFLGFLLGVLALELLLRGVGFAISLSDDRQRATASDGSRRVLCLGACYTIGLGSEPEQSYPAQLQDMLAEQYPQDPVAVINGGVRGKSLDYFSGRIETILDQTEPQVLVLNINDRIRFQAAELDELHRGPLRASLHWLGDYLVLARVLLLAIEGSPEDTGMPESWWEEAGSSETGGDQLEQEIAELEAVLRDDPEDIDALLRLARAFARRADFQSSIRVHDQLIELKPHKPSNYVRRAEDRIMAKDFKGAWQDLQLIPQRFPDFHDKHWTTASEGREEHQDDETWVHRNKRLAIYYLAWGKPEKAAELVSEVQTRRPGTAWSHDYADFVAAVLQALESGESVASQLPTADVLFERMEGSDIATVARYGLFEEDGLDVQADAAQAAESFELLLRHHLERVKRATDERGIALIVENMSSRPEQQRVLEEVCADLDIPLVPLQERLANHAQRAQLLHPSQSLRLSAEGNAFMAREILPVVVQALED